MVKVNTLLSDMPAPNKIRYMEKHMRGRNATRDLLWLAISEYEYEYNLTILTGCYVLLKTHSKQMDIK